MPRFTVGARVHLAEERTTGRVGTVIEVLPKSQDGRGADRYRVEFNEGDRHIHSDMELAPAGSGPTVPAEDDVA